MKKILFPILATVLIAFAIMPLAAGTVFADEGPVDCDGFRCRLDWEHNTAAICGPGGGFPIEEDGSLVIPETITYFDETNTDETYSGDNFSVTKIEDDAFKGNYDLSSVSFPASLTMIGSNAFFGCPYLETVLFADDNKLTTIDVAAFSSCSSLTSIDIPSSVNTIGQQAFLQTGLTSIVLPEGLELIDVQLFYKCGSLTEVTIPLTVTDIGDFAFSGCDALTTIHYGGTLSQWAAITPGIDMPVITPASYTVNDGDELTVNDNTSGTITIPAGASVTLSGVTIGGGIVCKGNATIILAGGSNNTANGADKKAGICVPKDCTLTIKGTGSLTAQGNNGGAGIGGNYTPGKWEPSGNIVIEGGTINATGDDGAAGIGMAYLQNCGDITITGGDVEARGGDGATGIGCGEYSHSNTKCGNITITDKVTRVTAYSGDGCDSAIGKGDGRNTCGTITIGGVVQQGDMTGSPFITEPYTISFFAGEGEGAMAAQTVMKNVNQEFELPANGFTAPAGKAFTEWSVVIGSAAAVNKAAGDKITITANTNVTAVFDAAAEIPAAKTGLIYNGAEQTGVEGGQGYTLSGTTAATNAGDYSATATLQDGYLWSDGTREPKTINWKISKATVKVTAPAGKTFTYDGKAKTGVAAGLNYTLSGTVKATKAGSYTAKATLNTDANYTYQWTDGTTAVKTIKWTINKAANTMKIKAKTATVKYSVVKKKAQKLGVTKVITFTNKGQGTKTYVKKSGNKKITIAKTTGKVTVKKGLKKGTYKVKVNVKAKGNANYKASAWKTVTFKITVK